MNKFIKMTLYILASCIVINSYASNAEILPSGKYWLEFTEESKSSEKPTSRKMAVKLINNQGTITITIADKSNRVPIVGQLKNKQYSGKIIELGITLMLVGKLVEVNLLQGNVTRTNREGEKNIWDALSFISEQHKNSITGLLKTARVCALFQAKVAAADYKVVTTKL